MAIYDGYKIMADLTVTIHRDSDGPEFAPLIRITVKCENHDMSLRCLLDLDKAEKFHAILGKMIAHAKRLP